MKTVKCAIYTRKSSDEGLEQAFNSLDAQREACAAYILSQASEGWTALPDLYDDGGLSGGTLERPALQRLLGEVAAGRVDIIVVYKVDRLTRSLLDFSKLWIARTGSPWRDLHALFGNWSTAYRRFRDWHEADVFRRIFDALSEEPDMEYAMGDATIVKVHRHGQGAKGGLHRQAPSTPPAASLGTGRWSLQRRQTTKIVALTDAPGNLVRFRLMPGNRFDSIGISPLIEGVEFGALLGEGFRQQR